MKNQFVIGHFTFAIIYRSGTCLLHLPPAPASCTCLLHLPPAPASCHLRLPPTPAFQGRRKTFKIPFFAARSIACTPRERGYSSLIKLSMSRAPFFKRSKAGSNRPHREPTIEISSTTSRD